MGLDRLRLYASAIAGRTIDVAAAEPGALSWTDGSTVFLDASADGRDQISMLSVQCSLLAADSLRPAIADQLIGHRSTARRYLTIEAHRALAANAALLPRAVRALVDADIASTVATPDDSLEMARGRHVITELTTFGAIHPRRVLDAADRVERLRRSPSETPASPPVSRLDEIGDEDDDDHFDFSSPVGGGGPVGRVMRRLLGPSRSRRGAPPGADAPTHATNAPGNRGHRLSGSVTSGMPDRVGESVAVVGGTTMTYPEWDVRRTTYRPDWCTVVEHDAPSLRSTTTMADTLGLHRPLARLGLELTHCRRQPHGDDIDVDATVEAFVDRVAGSPHDDDFYVASLRRRRDLAVLVLLDVSGSAGEAGAGGRSVHEHQRSVAAALTVALHELGDRVALYAFNSRGRRSVHLFRVKQFEDPVDGRVTGRLHGLAPAAYTRLGTAIRHGTALVEQRGGTPRRLLVVLSDGFAYDHGYEGRYGEADARRSLIEARRRGVGCLCLSIGATTDPGALRRVFGSAAHASVPRPEQLPRVIGPLFRAAVTSAEAQRRAYQRRERTRHRLEVVERR